MGSPRIVAEENQGRSAVDGNPSGYVNLEALEEIVRQAGALNRMQLIEEAITESKSPAFSLEWVYPQADAELRDAAALAEGDPGGRLLAADPNAQAQDTWTSKHHGIAAGHRGCRVNRLR